MSNFRTSFRETAITSLAASACVGSELDTWYDLATPVTSKFSQAIPENLQLIPAHQTRKFPESGVALEVIKNATLICSHRTIVVLDSNGAPVNSCQIGDMERVNRISKNKKRTDYNATLALLTSMAPECYYHWLVDTLPGLEVLDATPFSVDSIDWFYTANYCQEFQKESFAKYGITDDRVISSFRSSDYTDETTLHAKFDKILIPRFRDLEGGWPNRWIVPRMQSRFQIDSLSATQHTHGKKSYGNKVYITRGTSRRRVINEKKILPFLADRGIQFVDMSKMSISEQAKLAASADLICGAHGAGLSNALFAKPGTKLIEFCGPYISRHFRILAEIAGLDYAVLDVGIDARGNKLRTSNAIEYRSTDFHIDVRQFEAALGEHLDRSF